MATMTRTKKKKKLGGRQNYHEKDDDFDNGDKDEIGESRKIAQEGRKL